MEHKIDTIVSLLDDKGTLVIGSGREVRFYWSETEKSWVNEHGFSWMFSQEIVLSGIWIELNDHLIDVVTLKTEVGNVAAGVMLSSEAHQFRLSKNVTLDSVYELLYSKYEPQFLRLKRKLERRVQKGKIW